MSLYLEKLILSKSIFAIVLRIFANFSNKSNCPNLIFQKKMGSHTSECRSRTSECRSGAFEVLRRRRQIYESQEQKK